MKKELSRISINQRNGSYRHLQNSNKWLDQHCTRLTSKTTTNFTASLNLLKTQTHCWLLKKISYWWVLHRTYTTLCKELNGCLKFLHFWTAILHMWKSSANYYNFIIKLKSLIYMSTRRKLWTTSSVTMFLLQQTA